MTIRREEANKNTQAVVYDHNKNVVKIVDLHHREIGTPSIPKNVTIWGDVVVQGQLSASHVSGSIQSKYQSTPSDFAGLTVWLEAAKQNCVFETSGINGDRVLEWRDLSGNKNDMHQTTSTNAPKWCSANIMLSGSKMPSLEFNSNQYLVTKTNVTVTSFTIIVGIINKTSTTMIIEHSEDSGANDGSRMYTGAAASWLVSRGGLYDSKDNPVGADWGIENAYPQLWAHTYDGAHAKNRFLINNVDIVGTSNSTSAPEATSTSSKYYLGGRGTTPDLPMSGSIFCVAIYTPALPPFQTQKVVRYFADKFGVQCC